MSMSLEQQLEKFSTTDKWKKLIKNAKVGGSSASSKGRQSTKSIGMGDVEIVSDILTELLMAIKTKFPEMSSSMFNIYDMGYRGDTRGRNEYRVYFHNVGRPSIYPEGYPDGLENVLALFSHGSEPSKNAVWDKPGLEWNFGKRGRGIRKQRREYRKGYHIFIQQGWYKKPDPFLINAVERLLSKYPDADIILDRKYYP